MKRRKYKGWEIKHICSINARANIKNDDAAATVWVNVRPGVAIGYRRGTWGATWYDRRLRDGVYIKTTLGNVEDSDNPADGKKYLSYEQVLIAIGTEKKPEQITAEGATVKMACDHYMEYAKSRTQSSDITQGAIDAYIIPSLGDRVISTLTKGDIEKWHRKMVQNPVSEREVTDDPESIRKRWASANRTMTTLKAALNRYNEELNLVPVWNKAKRKADVDKGRDTYLTHDQLMQLIDAAKGTFKNYVKALAYTGARPGRELELLKVKDFDSRSGTLTVFTYKRKGNATRAVALTDEAIDFFKSLTIGRDPQAPLIVDDDGKTWTKDSYRLPWKKTIKAAGMTEIQPYLIRHAVITTAVKSGIPIFDITAQYGTSETMIRKSYYKHMVEDRRKLLNGIMPSFETQQANVTRLQAKR